MGLVSFTQEDYSSINYHTSNNWTLFQQKIICPFKLFLAKHIFTNYTRYFLTKFIKNGYYRIEVRSVLSNLNEYDPEGNLIKTHPPVMTRQCIDEVVDEITQTYP